MLISSERTDPDAKLSAFGSSLAKILRPQHSVNGCLFAMLAGVNISAASLFFLSAEPEWQWQRNAALPSSSLPAQQQGTL